MKLSFTIFTIILVSILTKLGFWQLNRYKYKLNYINNIKQSLSLKYVDDEINIVNKDNLYRKIRIKGNYDNSNTILVYKNIDNIKKNGYVILTPFKTKLRSYIVLRGWISYNIKKDEVISILNSKYIKSHKNKDQESIELEALVIPGEKKSVFSNMGNMLNTIDTKSISDSLSINNDNIYLFDLNNYEYKDIKQIEINKILNIRNKHFEYMFTWFLLAIIIGLIYFSKICKIYILNK